LRSRPWRWWPHPRTLLALQLVWKAAPSSGYVFYGPRYENRPVVQTGPPALLTAPPMSTNVSEHSESAFASNADIQWPSLNSMIGIVGDSCMSAAAPVPFTQGKRADMQASNTNAPVQPTLPPAQPEHAKITLPLASLTLQQLQSLKEKCPEAHVEVKV